MNKINNMYNTGLMEAFNDLSLEEAISLYNDTLKDILDNHCPLILKKFEKKSEPWRDRKGY